MSQRIDKYLWCIRIFKTRSLATQACREGKVTVGNSEAKASRELKPNDVISVKKGPIRYSYRVMAFPKARLGAKLVPEYAQDLTPPEEREKLLMLEIALKDRNWFGLGRPTKKNRREMDKFLSDDDD
jgi:ribosome-associated heat shock protein Hsp15